MTIFRRSFILRNVTVFCDLLRYCRVLLISRKRSTGFFSINQVLSVIHTITQIFDLAAILIISPKASKSPYKIVNYVVIILELLYDLAHVLMYCNSIKITKEPDYI